MCKALDDLYQDGVDEGIKTGIKRGIQQGIEQGIKAFILDYREEGYDKEKILMKLQTRFSLTREQSEEYFSRF